MILTKQQTNCGMDSCSLALLSQGLFGIMLGLLILEKKNIKPGDLSIPIFLAMSTWPSPRVSNQEDPVPPKVNCVNHSNVFLTIVCHYV